MAFEFDAGTAGALALAGNIHLHTFITTNIQQMGPRRLRFIINPLQLEGIKPNSAAAALANIDHQATDLSLGQFVETRWAFHTFQFCIEIALNCNVDFDPLRPKTSLVFHTLDPQVLISTGA